MAKRVQGNSSGSRSESSHPGSVYASHVRGLNLDRMSYLILECDRAGNIWIAEREWADMDRATTVDDIASGQFENLVSVIEFNPVEHGSRDVTEDFASEVAARWADEPLNEFRREFIEFHLGVSVANRFAQAAE